MNKYRVLASIIFIAILSHAIGAPQRPLLQLSSQSGTYKTLQLTGVTNTYYRIESSSNLVNWATKDSYFLHTNNPSSQVVAYDEIAREYFRASMFPSNWVSMNNTIPDTCPEHDNVSVVIKTNKSHFKITATHPADYVVETNSCDTNWFGCLISLPTADFYQGPQVIREHVYDVGEIYVQATRDEYFWRPLGMTVKKDGVTMVTNATYIEVGGYLTGTADEYPIYFALYADGYVRLIPFPPPNFKKICFGSSVIVGPAAVESRPHADIVTADFITATYLLRLTYRSGGTANIEFDTDKITRTNATIGVAVNYSTSASLCTFRSMYVGDGNSDCDRVVWTDGYGVVHEDSILSFSATTGTNWFFKRHFRSLQRESAPDIRITLQ